MPNLFDCVNGFNNLQISILIIGYIWFGFFMIRFFTWLINWFKDYPIFPPPAESPYEHAKKILNVKAGSINITTDDKNAQITINGKRIKTTDEG